MEHYTSSLNTVAGSLAWSLFYAVEKTVNEDLDKPDCKQFSGLANYTSHFVQSTYSLHLPDRDYKEQLNEHKKVLSNIVFYTNANCVSHRKSQDQKDLTGQVNKLILVFLCCYLLSHLGACYWVSSG